MTLEFPVFSVAIDDGAVVVECGKMYDISTFRQRNCTREENKSCAHMYACMYSIMEYGSTPYVGLTPKKHGRHTLVQILFSTEN